MLFWQTCKEDCRFNYQLFDKHRCESAWEQESCKVVELALGCSVGSMTVSYTHLTLPTKLEV